jgi:nitroreductase
MPELTDAILGRRTSKPATFSKDPPDPKIIRKCIEIARNAPNHHRTEPARFYLLDSERIQKIGQLFGEVVAGDRSDPALIERGKKKSKEWGNSPGLLIVTCLTDRDSELVKKKPEVIDEDYATCSCICQNLLLLLEDQGIATKWSTGAVWKHSEFPQAIKMISPESERVVGLIFFGFAKEKPPTRPLRPLNDHLKDFTLDKF